MNIPRFVVAGTHSGSGKSSITLGLLRALRRRGLAVQPFKAGPDFIDPTLHTAAAGRISRNLDSWLLPRPTILELLARAAEGADVAVIEGMMGLYDGYGGGSDEGSTADVAKIVRAPVVLVMDVSGSARSAAAAAMGFAIFDPEIIIAGVIANRAGGARHVQALREALAQSGIPLLGAVPWDDRLQLPERHLGLVPAEEHPPEEVIEALADAIEAHVDLDAILHVAGLAPPVVVPGPLSFPPMSVPASVSIGVARDEAFTFYYQDALDILESRGARLVSFSPIRDADLPPVYGLYLGGGFPEVYARELSANQSMRRAVVQAVEDGMPVYAECGGMMYLARTIIDTGGQEHAMAGVLPAVTQMHRKLVALNYVALDVQHDTLLLRRGERVRGHEFHFSTVKPFAPVEYAFASAEGRGIEAGRDGFHTPTLLATYTHLHFAGYPAMAERFVQACQHYKDGTRD